MPTQGGEADRFTISRSATDVRFSVALRQSQSSRGAARAFGKSGNSPRFLA